MKIIIGIVASDNENYVEFKKAWVKNISQVKKNPQLANLFDFYFLYSDSKESSKQIMYKQTKQILYTDFYDKRDAKEFESVTHSLFFRTMSFFEYMIKIFRLNEDEYYTKYKDDGLFFVRTNLSTVFDFKVMSKWFEDKPKTNFFGGSFNGFYNGLYTTISGTNLIFSLDTMLFLTFNKDMVDMKVMLEDEAISQLIIHKLNIFIINVKRLDFIEMEEVRIPPDHVWPATPNSIVYHKTKIGDEDIFTFRFKTFNRDNDVIVMNFVIDELWKNEFRLNHLVNKVSNLYEPKLPLSEEGPTYGELYSKRPFKIFHLDFSDKLDEQNITLKIE
jgi:hypothetical protein